MISKETIKEILLENRKEIESQEVVHRNIRMEDFASYVLIGVRRAGKSSSCTVVFFLSEREEGCMWKTAR